MDRQPIPKKQNKKQQFKIYPTDFQDLFLSEKKLPKSLVDDLARWQNINEFRGFFIKNMYTWFHEKEERIIQTAKLSSRVIDNFLIQKTPNFIIEIYIEFLIKKKNIISKYLDIKDADSIYQYIPSVLTIQFLDLYRINLTDKQKNNLIDEFLNERKINKKINRLPDIFGEKEKYARILVEKLYKYKYFSEAASVVKKYNIKKETYPDLEIKLIQNSARSMPNWQKQKFSWDVLEEVYQRYPSAIAACINKLCNSKPGPSKQMRQGFASIIHRIPAVIAKLPNKLKQYLYSKQILPNKLRNNKFQPSDPQKYFSLFQFGIKEQDVIWVDHMNLDEAVKEVFTCKMIGIDTQSTVARTTLSTSYELLSIVQIANQKKIYIFDAKQLKQINYTSQIVTSFFQDQKNVVVGHTLNADLNQDVTSLFGFKGELKCQKIDICPIFKKHFPNIRAGLTSISAQILSKPICKEYTLTNWDRRPLLRNQIHYAALDALVVLKIWNILKELQKKSNKVENGEAKIVSKEEKQMEELLREQQQNEYGANETQESA